jgi:hypothetical protein
MPREQMLIRALLALLAMLIVAPCRAQSTVVPTSPDDPASKSLGWVEAAPAPALDRGSTLPLSPPEPAGSATAMRSVPHHSKPLRRVRRQVQHSRAMGVGQNNLANYLNRQELARLQGSNRASLQQNPQGYRR